MSHQTNAIARRYLAFGWAYLPIATIAVHLIGSSILGLVTGGINGLASAPFLAIFGLFFLPFEMVAVAAQWYLYYAYSFTKRAFLVLFAISAVPVPAVVAALGPKEENSEILWALGFGLGAAVAGVFTLLLLRIVVNTISRMYVQNDTGES